MKIRFERVQIANTSWETSGYFAANGTLLSIEKTRRILGYQPSRPGAISSREILSAVRSDLSQNEIDQESKSKPDKPSVVVQLHQQAGDGGWVNRFNRDEKAWQVW